LLVPFLTLGVAAYLDERVEGHCRHQFALVTGLAGVICFAADQPRDMQWTGTCRMKAQYQITEDDYVKVMRWNAWCNLVAKSSSPWLVAVCLLLGLAIWKLLGGGSVVALALLAFVIVFTIALRIAGPLRLRRQYRQYKAIQEPIIVELLDGGLRFSSADGESNVPWVKIFQWRQNERFVLVFNMPLLFHIVPKSIAREGFDVPLLVKRLADHVGPER
jgi:hypothetical protein